MNRRELLKSALGGLASAALTEVGSGCATAGGAPEISAELARANAYQRRPPNFILVVCDDLGYGDIEPHGGSIPTPSINRMAREGLIASDYYSAANLGSPAYAGLLTGRYPVRTGLGYESIVYEDERVLPLSERTIAAALAPDYTSGLFGKWQLGHTGPKWLPINYGFYRFFGIPYSHELYAPLPVYDVNIGTGAASAQTVDHSTLQDAFYTHAELFIESNRARPFFALLALSAPHLPVHPHRDFKGFSKFGPYGDIVREIDSLVGRLLDKLKVLKLEQDTIVIFTSSNGAGFEGSNRPLRDRKGGAGYDGGYRVPFLAWAPGLIRPGSKTNTILCGIDVLPTFCSLAGRGLPQGVEIDGHDISGVLTASARSPHDAVLLFDNEDVAALRTQKWKYVDRTYYRGSIVNYESQGLSELYDMSRDPGESYSVAQTYPEVTREMQLQLGRARLAFAPFRRGVPPAPKGAKRRRRQDG